MPRPLLANVISHWHRPYDGFQTSVLEFYSSVEAGIERRQIPAVSTRRIELHEGGGLSASRIYLRIQRQSLVFDLCAAPFGRGFFFSWWLAQRRPSRLVAVLLFGLLAAAFILMRTRRFQIIFRQAADSLAFLWFLAIPVVIAILLTAVVLIFSLVVRLFGADPEDAIIVVPVIGWLYLRLLRPVTYFRIDTILMFQSLVKAAVDEAIDGLLATKGLRALTEDEKKPVMRTLM